MLKKLLLFLLVWPCITFSQAISVDETFNEGGTGALPSVRDCVVQPDGKVIIVGSFSTYNGITAENVARLNLDGSLDETFNSGTGPNNSSGYSNIQSVALYGDGRIIVAGDFDTFNGVFTKGIVRLLENGAIDTTFDTGSVFNGNDFGTDTVEINKIAVTQEGKVLACGKFEVGVAPSETVDNFIRLTESGDVDLSFDYEGAEIGDFDQYHLMEIQQDGSILLGSVEGLKRIGVNGGIDDVFSENIASTLDYPVWAVYPLEDGKILIGGFFRFFGDNSNYILGRLNSDGSRDMSFEVFPATSEGNSLVIRDIEIFMDKYLIAGQFNSFGDTIIEDIALINTDGTIDDSFNIGPVHYGGAGVVSYVYGADVYGSLIYICGDFKYIGDLYKRGVARIGDPSLSLISHVYKNRLNVYGVDGTLSFASEQPIQKVTLFDIHGSIIEVNDGIFNTEHSFFNLPLMSKLVVKVLFSNGTETTLKTIVR